MTFIRGRLVPTPQEGPWYSDDGVDNREQALVYLNRFFPALFNESNFVSDRFDKAKDVKLLPKSQRTFGEPLIANAGNLSSRQNESSFYNQLRYYYPTKHGELLWELQFGCNFPHTTPFLAWKGRKGFPSDSLYCNFVDRVDLKFQPDGGVLQVRSMSGGDWTLTTTLYDPELKKKLSRLPLNSRYGYPSVILENIGIVDGSLQIEYAERTPSGLIQQDRVSIPHTVAPTRI